MKPTPLQIPKARTSADLATRMAEAARLKRKLAEEEAKRLPTGEAWVLGCNSDYKHVGIIFADGVDPRTSTPIHGGMWFSATHDISEPFFGTRDQILCSQCLAEGGAKNPLRVEVTAERNDAVGTCFIVPTRWHRYLHKVNVSHLAPYMTVAEPEPETPPEPDIPYAPPPEAPAVVVPSNEPHEAILGGKVAGTAKAVKA
jgi:hypothetical protein